MIRFAIDERSLDLNGLGRSQAGESLGSFLWNLGLILEADHGICYDEDLFYNELREGFTFWQLFDADAGLNLTPEDCELAAAIFGTMPKWHELDPPQPNDIDVKIDDGPVETSGPVAWAHARARQGFDAAACIALPHRRASGDHRVSVAGVERNVWFVYGEKDVQWFFRSLLSTNAETPDDFDRYSAAAFPDLLFVDKCFDGIRKMSKRCRDLAPTLVDHLTAFADEGQRIFSGHWQNAPAEFGALGIDVSDENGNSKGDPKAAKERLRKFDGEELYFWWHSKLERHQDRIHVCPDKINGGGKLIVGIFCLHLK
ncbi:hypothetical protein NKZ35_25350 [Sinorhizobium meliloti]|uniref:hypothetical protein n=1 Tax=Rhizobium meliloti TaxID=382 RepID=UPI003D654DA2